MTGGLHYISYRKMGHADVVLVCVIERGADLTAQTNDGWTSLHLASCWGQVEVARMLIERGADLTALNNYGSTPLHLASQNGQIYVARMLIVCGTDATAQNYNGQTPLHLALQTGTSRHCSHAYCLWHGMREPRIITGRHNYIWHCKQDK